MSRASIRVLLACKCGACAAVLPTWRPAGGATGWQISGVGSTPMRAQQPVSSYQALTDTHDCVQVTSNDRAAANAAAGDWQEVTSLVQVQHRASIYFPQCVPPLACLPACV